MATMNRQAQACAWYIRRNFAGLRQVEVSLFLGMSLGRYGSIEREEVEPTETERQAIDRILPALPPPVMEELQKVTSPWVRDRSSEPRRLEKTNP